jgi:NADPH:quinone reductase
MAPRGIACWFECGTSGRTVIQADIVVERGPGFAEAVRRQLPNGVDALLDTAALGEKSFGAIRDGGIYIPVRGWGDNPAERGIKIKP